jgi:hypothetical protein
MSARTLRPTPTTASRPLTPEAVRAHGRTVCGASVIHTCRICALLNRVFLDELRLRIGLERMPYNASDRNRNKPHLRIFGQSHAWRQDGRVSVFRHD